MALGKCWPSFQPTEVGFVAKPSAGGFNPSATHAGGAANLPTNRQHHPRSRKLARRHTQRVTTRASVAIPARTLRVSTMTLACLATQAQS